MKINSNRDKLSQAVSVVLTSVSSKATLPILQNLLMEAKDGKIKFIKTDLELATIHYISADVVEEGTVTLPAKEFSDIINTMPEDKNISLNTDTSNKVHLKCSKSKFWLMGSPKEEYPIIPDLSKSEVIKEPVGILEDMIRKTIFSASTQETRYVLNGVLWMIGKKGLEMVATDGRRLALAKNEQAKTDKDFKIIIPAKVLQELLKYLSAHKPDKDEKIEIGISSNQIGFKINETTFISRLIEGNFPNYKQVIPEKTEISFEITNTDLTAVTRRAGLCTKERGGAVKYEMKDGVLHVSASSQKMEFSDEIKTGYKGKDFECAFNPQYILDVLKNINSPKVVFSLTNPVNPVVVEPVGEKYCKYVIMPVRT
ncbi:MAG TPA: DNA polymerase III subunit beta [Elusimicrobiales bacterium]|nr:DNA polymerase III subunit beta [Elusimicrobiales bacterium]